MTLAIGVARGALWSREIRFFAIAALLTAFFMSGWYTPVFRVMYELMPGVKLFRRPADATFVFGFMIAIMTGYMVHRWLTDASRATLVQRVIELGIGAIVLGATVWLADTTVGLGPALKPIVTGIICVAVAILVLIVARRLASGAPVTATLLLVVFTTADLAWNNAPHESTGLPPARYDMLRADTQNETVALIKQRLAQQEPNHRDRIELVGIEYHWPNICLIHGCEQVFGHNPLRLKWFYDATRVGDTVAAAGQRPFSPLYPSWRSTFADLFGVRLIATGVPAEQIDKSLKPGDLDFVARTKDAYVYENPRALPRVMLVGDWKRRGLRQTERRGLAAGCRSAEDRAACAHASGAAWCRIGLSAARALREHRGDRRGRHADRRLAGAQRCVASVVARDGQRTSNARSCAPT